VEVNPSVKIRPLIDLKFIINNYIVAEERAPQAGDVPIYDSPTINQNLLEHSRKIGY